MRSYETARTIFGLLEFVAWTAVVVGIFVAFSGASAGSYYTGRAVGIIGAVPGIVLSLVGLIAAATVQYYRAGVDTAEMTGQMLRIAEEQLKIAKDSRNVSFTPGASFGHSLPSSSKPKSATATPGDNPQATTIAHEAAEATLGQGREATVYGRAPTLQTIEHSGVPIRRTEYGYFVGEMRFPALEQAKACVEERISQAKSEAQT